MIWSNISVMKNSSAGVDALGNKIAGTPVVLWSGTGRFTLWSDLQVQVEDRDVTSSQQLFRIPAPYETVKDAELAVVDGITYEITDKHHLPPRWTMLQLKVYKE